MNVKNLLLSFCALLTLGACTQMSANDAVVPLQTATAQMLGLGSSDELTLSNVNTTAPDAVGGQTISYTATTDHGRIFNCSALMTPGLLTAPPVVSSPTCQPVVDHQ